MQLRPLLDIQLLFSPFLSIQVHDSVRRCSSAGQLKGEPPFRYFNYMLFKAFSGKKIYSRWKVGYDRMQVSSSFIWLHFLLNWKRGRVKLFSFLRVCLRPTSRSLIKKTISFFFKLSELVNSWGISGASPRCKFIFRIPRTGRVECIN